MKYATKINRATGTIFLIILFSLRSVDSLAFCSLRYFTATAADGIMLLHFHQHLKYSQLHNIHYRNHNVAVGIPQVGCAHFWLWIAATSPPDVIASAGGSGARQSAASSEVRFRTARSGVRPDPSCGERFFHHLRGSQGGACYGLMAGTGRRAFGTDQAIPKIKPPGWSGIRSSS